MVFEETWQVDGEGDKSTERKEIEGGKCPREGLAKQDSQHVAQRPRLDGNLRIPRRNGKHNGPDNQHRGDKTKHVLPADADRKQRTEEDGRGLPDVAQSIDAERRALLLARKPGRYETDTHRER